MEVQDESTVDFPELDPITKEDRFSETDIIIWLSHSD
jgi:hypothetical protein